MRAVRRLKVVEEVVGVMKQTGFAGRPLAVECRQDISAMGQPKLTHNIHWHKVM